MTNITITYRTIDGHRMTRKFKTVRGARRFARYWIGDAVEIGRGFTGSYAVSSDGVGKIEATGISLEELFRGESASI